MAVWTFILSEIFTDEIKITVNVTMIPVSMMTTMEVIDGGTVDEFIMPDDSGAAFEEIYKDEKDVLGREGV